MYETPDGIFELASIPFKKLRPPTPVSLTASKPTPREQAAIDAIYPAKPAPILETKPLPAPEKAKGEGSGKQTEAASAAKAENAAPRIAGRRKRIEEALAKTPDASNQALANRLGVPRSTVRSDRKALSGHIVKP